MFLDPKEMQNLHGRVKHSLEIMNHYFKMQEALVNGELPEETTQSDIEVLKKHTLQVVMMCSVYAANIIQIEVEDSTDG